MEQTVHPVVYVPSSVLITSAQSSVSVVTISGFVIGTVIVISWPVVANTFEVEKVKAHVSAL